MEDKEFERFDEEMDDFAEIDVDLSSELDNLDEPVDAITATKEIFKEKLSMDNFTERLEQNIIREGPKNLGKAVENTDRILKEVTKEVAEPLKDLRRETSGLLNSLVSGLSDDNIIKKAVNKISSFIAVEDPEAAARENEEQQISQKVSSIFDNLIKKDLVESEVNKQLEALRNKTEAELLSIIAANQTLTNKILADNTAVIQREQLYLDIKKTLFIEKIYNLLKEYSNVTIEIFRGILKNTAMPDIAKLSSSEYLAHELRKKAFNKTFDLIKNNDIVKNVTENLKEKALRAIDTATSAVTGVKTFVDMSQEFGMSPLEIALDMTIGETLNKGIDKVQSKLIKSLLKTKAGIRSEKELDKLTMDFPAAIKLLKEKIEGQDKQSIFDKQILNILNLLEEAAGSAKSVNTIRLNSDDLDQPAIFDNRVKKAITVVIPTLLSKILAELEGIRTGKKVNRELVYDYEANKFKTNEDLKRELIKTISKSNRDLSKSLNNETIFKVLESAGKLSKEERKIVKEALVKHLSDGGTTSPYNLIDSEFIRLLPEKTRAKVKKSLNKLIKSEDPEALELAREFHNSLELLSNDINNVYRNISAQASKISELGRTDILQDLKLVDIRDHNVINMGNLKTLNQEVLSKYTTGIVDANQSLLKEDEKKRISEIKKSIDNYLIELKNKNIIDNEKYRNIKNTLNRLRLDRFLVFDKKLKNNESSITKLIDDMINDRNYEKHFKEKKTDLSFGLKDKIVNKFKNLEDKVDEFLGIDEESQKLKSEFNVVFNEGETTETKKDKKLKKKVYFKNIAKKIEENLGGYKKGGYTGKGKADEPAGIVHKGEYVIPKKTLNKLVNRVNDLWKKVKTFDKKITTPKTPDKDDILKNFDTKLNTLLKDIDEKFNKFSLRDTKDKIVNKITNVKESEKIKEIKEKALDLKDKGLDKLSDFKKYLEENIKINEKISKTIEEFKDKDKTLIETLKDRINDLKDNFETKVSSLKETYEAKFKSIRTELKSAKDKIKNAVEKINIVEKISDLKSDLFKNIKSVTSEKYKDLKEIGEKKYKEIKENITKSEIGEKITNKVTKAKDLVNNKDKLKRKIKKILRDIKSRFVELDNRSIKEIYDELLMKFQNLDIDTLSKEEQLELMEKLENKDKELGLLSRFKRSIYNKNADIKKIRDIKKRFKLNDSYYSDIKNIKDDLNKVERELELLIGEHGENIKKYGLHKYLKMLLSTEPLPDEDHAFTYYKTFLISIDPSGKLFKEMSKYGDFLKTMYTLHIEALSDLSHKVTEKIKNSIFEEDEEGNKKFKGIKNILLSLIPPKIRYMLDNTIVGRLVKSLGSKFAGIPKILTKIVTANIKAIKDTAKEAFVDKKTGKVKISAKNVTKFLTKGLYRTAKATALGDYEKSMFDRHREALSDLKSKYLIKNGKLSFNPLDYLKFGASAPLELLKADLLKGKDESGLRALYKDIGHGIKDIGIAGGEHISRFIGLQSIKLPFNANIIRNRKIVESAPIPENIKAMYFRGEITFKDISKKLSGRTKAKWDEYLNRINEEGFDSGLNKAATVFYKSAKTFADNVYEPTVGLAAKGAFSTAKGAGKFVWGGIGSEEVKEGISSIAKGGRNVTGLAANILRKTGIGTGKLGLKTGKKVLHGVKEFIGFKKGGYTGKGKKDDVAGIVHKDEFVINSETLNKLVDKIKNLLKEISKKDSKKSIKIPNLTNIKDKVKEKVNITNIKDKIKEKFDKHLELVINKFKEKTKEIENKVNEKKDNITDIIKKKLETIDKKTELVKEKIKSIKDTVVNKIKSIKENIKEVFKTKLINKITSISKIKDRIKDNIKTKMHFLREKLTNIKDKINYKQIDKVKDITKLHLDKKTYLLVKTLKEIKDNLSKKVKKNVFDRDGDGIRDGSWKERLLELKNKTKDKVIKNVVEKVKDKKSLGLLGILFTVGGWLVKKIKDFFLGGFLKVFGKLFKNIIWEPIKWLATKLGGFLATGLKSAAKLATTGAAAAASKIKDIAGGIKDKLTKPAETASKPGFFATIIDKAKSGIEKAKSFVKDKAAKVATVATYVGSKIKEKAVTAVDKVKDFGKYISDKFKGFKQYFIEKLGKVLVAGKDIVSKVKTLIGKNVSLVKIGDKILHIAKSGLGKITSGAKLIVKKIPGIGLVIGTGEAIYDALHGNFKKAGLHLLAGAATTIPVIGTGASIALDLAAHSIDEDKKDESFIKPDKIVEKPIEKTDNEVKDDTNIIDEIKNKDNINIGEKTRPELNNDKINSEINKDTEKDIKDIDNIIKPKVVTDVVKEVNDKQEKIEKTLKHKSEDVEVTNMKHLAEIKKSISKEQKAGESNVKDTHVSILSASLKVQVEMLDTLKYIAKGIDLLYLSLNKENDKIPEKVIKEREKESKKLLAPSMHEEFQVALSTNVGKF